MTLEYKLRDVQRRKYIFVPLLKLVAIVAVGSIISVTAFGIRKDEIQTVIGWTLVWIFFMHFLPLLIMAIRHNQLSKDASFAFDSSTNTYQYKGKDISLSFALAEIDKVVKVVSPPKYDERMDFLGFGYFYYWKIVLVDGRTLSMSCMLLDVDSFPGRDLSKEKKIFPIPPSNQSLRLHPSQS